MSNQRKIKAANVLLENGLGSIYPDTFLQVLAFVDEIKIMRKILMLGLDFFLLQENCAFWWVISKLRINEKLKSIMMEIVVSFNLSPNPNHFSNTINSLYYIGGMILNLDKSGVNILFKKNILSPLLFLAFHNGFGYKISQEALRIIIKLSDHSFNVEKNCLKKYQIESTLLRGIKTLLPLTLFASKSKLSFVLSARNSSDKSFLIHCKNKTALLENQMTLLLEVILLKTCVIKNETAVSILKNQGLLLVTALLAHALSFPIPNQNVREGKIEDIYVMPLMEGIAILDHGILLKTTIQLINYLSCWLEVEKKSKKNIATVMYLVKWGFLDLLTNVIDQNVKLAEEYVKKGGNCSKRKRCVMKKRKNKEKENVYFADEVSTYTIGEIWRRYMDCVNQIVLIIMELWNFENRQAKRTVEQCSNQSNLFAFKNTLQAMDCNFLESTTRAFFFMFGILQSSRKSEEVIKTCHPYKDCLELCESISDFIAILFGGCLQKVSRDSLKEMIPSYLSFFSFLKPSLPSASSMCQYKHPPSTLTTNTPLHLNTDSMSSLPTPLLAFSQLMLFIVDATRDFAPRKGAPVHFFLENALQMMLAFEDGKKK